MPENPIYDFMKANRLTDKDEATFLREYSDSAKAKELFSFFQANKLTDKDFNTFYGTYLKKKASIADVGMVAKGGGQVGVSKAPSNGLTITGEETALDRSIKERQRQATEIEFDENDPVKSLLLPIENKIAEKRSRQVSSSTSVAAPVLKMGISFEKKELVDKKREIEDSRFFGTTEEAVNFLLPRLDKAKLVREKPIDITKSDSLDDYSEESILQAYDSENLTLRKAAKQYIDNRNIREDIATSTSLEEAAIKNAIRKGDVISKQIKSVDELPNAMKGMVVMDFLQNPELNEEAQKNPELLNEIRTAYYELPKKYPLAAIKIMAQMASKVRENKGYNNGIINFTSDKVTDDIINDLVESGELPSQYKDLYEKPEVRMLVNSNLKTSGFVENLLKSTEESILGIGKTVADITQVRKLYSDKEDRTFKALEKDYSNVAFKPKGFWHEIFTQGGIVAGQVLPMMAGGNLIKSANLVNNLKTSNAIMAGLQTFGNNIDRALVDLPGESDQVQVGYATINTGIEVALSNIMNDAKLANTLMKGIAPEVKTIVTKFANKEITAAAAKEGVKNLFTKIVPKATSFIKGTTSVAVKEANEESATELLQKANNQVFGGEPITVGQAAADAFEVWRTTFLGTLPLGLGGGIVEINKNPSMPKLLFEMAENPEKYVDIMKSQAAIDETYAKDIDQKLDNLQYIVDVKSELDNREMKKADKEKYLLKSLSEKILSEKASTIPDKGLRVNTENQIKTLELEKQHILDQDNSNTKIVMDYFDNDLLDGASKMMLSNEEGKFSESKVGEYLKTIAQQSNGLDSNWKPLKDGKPKLPDVPEEIKEIANERWKKEIESAEQPIIDQIREIDMGSEEITQPIELSIEPKAEAGSVGVGGDVEKPINWSKERLDKEIEKLDPYESQGYGVTRNRSLKESMVDSPDKARLAFELRDFFKRMYKKDFEKDFDKRPLSSLSQFFYTDAKSLKDWVDNQIEAINNSIKSNQEYIDSLSNSKSDTKSKEMWSDAIENSKKEIEKLKSEFQKYEQEKSGIDKKGDNVEISSKNSINEQNKEATDFGKVISASSRFRPAETVVFDKPIIGKNGNKLISYQWAYEWTMQPSGKDSELKSKRISDWTQAESSAETGRDIVHKFTVERKDGTVVTVSSETIPSLLGYVDAAEMKNLPSVISSVKTLAKQRMQLAILKAQESEYNKIKQEVEKGSKPDITIATKEELPFVTRKMIDSGRLDPNEFTYFKMGGETYRQDGNSKNPTKETIEQLTGSWVKKEVENRGGKKPSGLYDLERRIERQEKKVEQATGSKLNPVEQSLKETPKAEAPTPKPKEQTPVSESGGKKSNKGVIKKARGIEDLTDPRDIVMQYFAGGNKISSSAIKELFGGKDERLHFSKGTGGEQKAKISLIKGDAPTIKDLAHKLWEASGGLEEGYQYTDRDFRDAIESVLQDHNSPTSMSIELVDKYINKAVKQELTDQEAKDISDGLIRDITKYVEELPENQQNELVKLLSKYQDKFGFIDWDAVEKDSNGFDPDILSLTIETQEALDGIIQKNLKSGQSELSDASRQSSSQEKGEEKITPQKKPEETPKTQAKDLADKVRKKEDIEKLPKEEREAAIDDLIFGEEGEMSPDDVVNPQEAVNIPHLPLKAGVGTITVKETLNHLINNKNKFSELAKEILENADIESLNADVSIAASKGFRSKYLSSKDRVILDVKDASNATIIIHEIIHATTSKKIPINLKNPSHGNSYGKAYLKELQTYLKEDKGDRDTKQLIRLYLKAVNELGFTKQLFDGDSEIIEVRNSGHSTLFNNGEVSVGFYAEDGQQAKQVEVKLKKEGFDAVAVSQGRSYGWIVRVRNNKRNPKDALSLDFVKIKDNGWFEYSFPYELKSKSTAGNADLSVKKGAPYGLGNLDEFLAEAFSSESFQKKLASIKDDSGVSLWQKFITAIKNLLGIETEGTLLNSVIKTGANIISKQRDANIQRLSELQSPVNLEAAKERMREAGYSDSEIKAEFEKRGLQFESQQEPPKPPKEEKTEAKDGGGKKKGVLTHLYEAKNIPEAAREGFKKEGLKYETKSQEEAEQVAKSIIDELGLDDAIELAEAQKFDGDVNSLIYAESLNTLKEQEDAAKTPEEKIASAKRFAEVGIMYDEAARKGGRFNAAINYFYKKSPLGIVMMENMKRGEDFNNWAKPKDKSWQEFFDDLMNINEFKDVVKGKVDETLKKERQGGRAKRIEKVRSAFKAAKEKFRKEGGGTYSTIIPPHIMETVLETMELAYEAGEAVAKIISDAVDYISKELKTDVWDKDKFISEWEEKLRDTSTKKTLTDEEIKSKIIDKFRKKLKGLSDKQKEDVIRRAYKKLIDAGALEFDDFKEIIAQVTGRAELTADEINKMKELVAKTNAVGDAAKKVQEERSEESLKEFRDAEVEAGKATRELNDLFYNKPDIVKRLTSIMQLSTLGIPALVNNPIYNIWNQSTLRFPIAFVNDLIDRTMSAVANLTGKTYEKEYNILAAQKGFWNQLSLGAKESIEQVGTGLNRQDYIQKEVYGQQIRPFKAIRDIIAYSRGKKPLTRRQYFDKLIQGTVGIPAEAVARLLNIGDKPQRFAAEGGQASIFAKALGLKDIDYKIFMEFPREEAYRAYKAQGLSDEVASQKADYIKEAIIKEGQRSTFQQDNLLNDFLTRAFSIFGGKDSGTANLTKTLAVSPYIKIPSNAFWSLYNLLNPEIAILQSFVHGGRSKYLNNKGEQTKSQLANREARYWMAHAIVGMAMRAVVIALVKEGIFTPGSDEDDSRKERDAVSYFDKPGTTNIGGVKISNRWFGQWGMMGNAIAKKYRDATPEQRENQDEFWNIVLGGMEVEGLKELENGIFANSSSLLQSLNSGSWDRYGMNTINMFSNILQPATVAQINRASLNEVPTARGDNFLEKLNQNFAQRSTLYRNTFDVQIKQKRDIWGQHIPKGGNVLSRMFGISKENPQLFSRPIYDDYLRTNDSGFLPPSVSQTLNGKKLTENQYDKLQEYVGNERKRLIEPYVNDMAEIEGIQSKYSNIKSEDKKKEYLNRIYDIGRKNGLNKFYKDYPELKPKK